MRMVKSLLSSLRSQLDSTYREEIIAGFQLARKFDAELFLISVQMLRQLLEYIETDNE